MTGERVIPRVIEPLQSPEYKMPTKVYFGRGEAKKLPDLVRTLPNYRFLLVTGAHLKGSGLLRELLRTGKVDTYSNSIKKSNFETVDNLTLEVRRGGFDGIIGIGGGAVLDCAKAAAALVTNGGMAENHLVSQTRKITRPALFYIAVPTTSGTGSEVTPWAVVWGKDKKYSLSSTEFMFPNIAIVDPALTDSLPPETTAESGVDALCQSIEAFWNVRHNERSDSYALESIKTVLGSLEEAVNDPTEDVRDKMAWGSLTGGLAFSNTQTTICHSVSYPMTIRWGIPHGQATSITLPLFIEYTFPVLPEDRRKKILEAMGVRDEKNAAEKVRDLMKSIGLKTKLSELEIPREGIDIIINEGFDSTRAGNAPKVPTSGELKEMLLGIF